MVAGFGLTDGGGTERLCVLRDCHSFVSRTTDSSLQLSNIRFRVEFMNESPT